MADQGFPVGGDADRRCFPVKMYAKMKELGPVAGGRVPNMPPRSAIVRIMLKTQRQAHDLITEKVTA